ncbi:MAG: type IV pilus assembly protein PilM [Desulfobacterales bacterium]|nr:type IV pilus assembly protein PilM [Desulfobacterales bacterium]
MFSRKKDTLVGLDIGSSAIKVAEVVETKKGRMLKKIAIAPVPYRLIEEGSIKDAPAVASIIKQLWKSENIKEKKVAISIGGYSVINKKVLLDRVSEDKLQVTINQEAEQYIPFDIKDVNLDFQILDDSSDGKEKMNVLLVAAKKEMINEYVNLLDLAGLSVLIIDVDAFALQNIYEFIGEVSNDLVALLDIGAYKTTLNIMKGTSSLFIRDVSLGCGQITTRIQSFYNKLDIKEAEDVWRGASKVSLDKNKIRQSDVDEIVSRIVSEWCAEITRALDFFYSSNDERIKTFILSGGGANIKEFRTLLSQQASAAVKMFNPFKGFETGYDQKYLDNLAPQVAICMGLSLRRVNDK